MKSLITFIFSIFLALHIFAQSISDCNSWANFTTRTTRGISIGNVTVTGQHLTVEAQINPSEQYTLTSSGDIVSKHAWPTDCNYLLRPDRGEITISDGVHYSTPPICSTLKGKTYHVAITYDGEELVFYRNGERMSSIKCVGDLIQNNWNTVIGAVATQNTTVESYVGYVNEVRIWNITRSPDQIRTYMDKSIVAPTSEPGLLAYYRFNSLKNLQGNTLYDGKISESLSYPSAVPSCILMDNGCPSSECQSFAIISSANNGFRAGDIDVSGNQITVEALVNCSGPYFNSSTVEEQNIVSKHLNPSDVNYLLRMNHAEITTSNGFYKTDDVCNLTYGQTFHLAMVYDGTNLKFYRNGQLMSQKPCRGNMVLNDWVTTIGAFAAQRFDASVTLPQNATLNGYINEVRIWNVARSVSDINSFKDKVLPSPSTQAGLLAYYQFNDLKNKQGNASYDLSLLGSPSINQTNPSCSLGVDPCPKCNLTSSFDFKSDVCDPSHFILSNTTANVNSYLWQFGDNNIPNATTSNTEVNYTNSGNYVVSLQVSDDKGCSATSTKTLAATTLPNIIETPTSEVCKGNTITLSSSIKDAGTKYSWSSNTQLSNQDQISTDAKMQATTTFRLDVEKSNGCQYNNTVLITVPDAASFAMNSADTTVCTNIHKEIALRANGGDVYQWKDENGNIVGLDPILNVDAEATKQYSVDVSSSKCGEKATFVAMVKTFPETNLAITSSNTIDCANPSTTLTVKNAKQINWDNIDGLVVNGMEASITPTQTTTYSAQVEDQYGCVSEVDYTQNVIFDPSASHFFVPNAFTPNGDGRNDIFRIRSDVTMNRFILRIFNRYGQLVFQTKNQSEGWDGRVKKNLQPMGTYVFEIIGSSSFCGEYHKKGSLVLIR